MTKYRRRSSFPNSCTSITLTTSSETGPSTSSHESQSPTLDHEERLDHDERLARRKERLGREEERLAMERLGGDLDRLWPITRSMAKHIQAQLKEATDGREKALYMLHKGPLGMLSN